MKEKNKKKSIIKRILAFTGATFCAIVCAFSLFNYTDTKSMEVSADTIITDSVAFEGSYLLVPTSYFYYKYNSSGNRELVTDGSQNYEYGTDFYNDQFSLDYRYLYSLFKVRFSNDQDTGALRFAIYSSYIDIVDNNGYSNFSGHQSATSYSYFHYMSSSQDNYKYGLINTDGQVGYNNYNLTDFADGRDIIIGPQLFDYYGICVEIAKSTIDIVPSKIVKCTINTTINNSRSRYIVTYYDTSNNYVSFSFANGKSTYLLGERTYYFSDAYDFTDNEYYIQGFSDGESKGYLDGLSKGESKGYSEGFNKGKGEGFWEGKASVLEGEHYSFTSLITSVIDVPVKTFTSLFNFEILGVNLSGFLLGLFTLSVAIFIIKLII